MVNVPHIAGTMVGAGVAHIDIPIGISWTGTAQTHRPPTSSSVFTNGEEIHVFFLDEVLLLRKTKPSSHG